MHLRTLIIQHKADSSEAKVLSILLSSMQSHLPEGGHSEVMVIQFGHERLAHGERLREIPGVQVISIDIAGSLGEAQPRLRMLSCLLRLVVALPNIVARARAFQPDLIYTSQQRWDMRLAIILSALLRCPHVVHLHYLPGPWLAKDIMWRLRRCSQVICVSQFVRQKAGEAGVPIDRTVGIRNVLPMDSVATTLSRDEARNALCTALGIPCTDVLVGMVARIAPGKGQRELVHAMAPLLTQKDASSRLILVGSETYPELHYAQEVLQGVEREGIADRVHWLGARADVPDLLRAFDVFAHPSFDEPCGLSVIEALLAGLPCVVWRVGGPAELVVDGETGILVETGNIEALTAALAHLCQHTTLREQMHHGALAHTSRVADTPTAGKAFYDVLKSVSIKEHRPFGRASRNLA